VTKRTKIAYLVSHPIQYQAPMLRHIAADPDIDLTVFFMSDFSVKEHKDQGFGTSIQWDLPLLEGYKYKILPSIGPNYPLTKMRPFNYSITSHLAKGHFDILWTHGYATLVSFRAILIAKALGLKVFTRTDTGRTCALRTAGLSTLKETFVKLLFRQIDGFLATSTSNADYYRSLGVSEDRIFSVPLCVDNDFFQDKVAQARPNRDALLRELGLEKGRPIILFAAKYQPRKRAIDLLHAYKLLSSDGICEPKPYLLFIGAGEQAELLNKQVSETGWSSVKVLGFKNQTELPAYYDLCDIFVLPSSKEPFGLSINEVMNAGRAVIVTDEVGCAQDLVKNDVNGYVVPVGDIRSLADRLQTLTSDVQLCTKMGQESLSLINAWSFKEDLAGVKQAVSYVLK